MMVGRGIGIEIRLRSFDRHLAQQADLGELVQRVVDGGQRHRHLGAGRLFVKHFGGEVAVALAEQQPAERHALARRPQADLAQHRLHVMPRATRKLRAVGRLRRRGGRYIREYHGARLVHRYAQTASPGGPANNRFICNIYALAP
jgi:hypothetical protein